jgi:hypothetical protein
MHTVQFEQTHPFSYIALTPSLPPSHTKTTFGGFLNANSIHIYVANFDRLQTLQCRFRMSPETHALKV